MKLMGRYVKQISGWSQGILIT